MAEAQEKRNKMNWRDLKAKQSLARATDSIRNKFRQIRSTHLENKRLLEEQYKPISKRLGKLIEFKEDKTKKKSAAASTPIISNDAVESEQQRRIDQFFSIAPQTQVAPRSPLIVVDDSDNYIDDDFMDVAANYDVFESGVTSNKRSSDDDENFTENVKRRGIESSSPSSSQSKATTLQISQRLSDAKKKQFSEIKELLQEEQSRRKERRSLHTMPIPFIVKTEAKSYDDNDGDGDVGDDNDDDNVDQNTPHRGKRIRKDENVLQAEKRLAKSTTSKSKIARARLSDYARDLFHAATEKRDDEAREHVRRDPNIDALKAQIDREAAVKLFRLKEADIKPVKSPPKDKLHFDAPDEARKSRQETRKLRPRSKSYVETIPTNDEPSTSNMRMTRARSRRESLDVRPQSPARGNGLIDLSVKQFKLKNAAGSYTYWNDPNELVDRLRLLISSTSAGHSGHQNEIVSIIEELREANIIE